MVFDFFATSPVRRAYADKEKQPLHKKQEGKCNGCERKYQLKDLTVEHKKPLSLGGSDRPSNWQLLCAHCNSTKGNATQAYLKKRLHELGILKKPAAARPAARPTKKPTSRRAR